MSTTGAAQRNPPIDNHPLSAATEPQPPFRLTEPPPLRREVAERLAAHRARRGLTPAAPAPLTEDPAAPRSRTSRVRSANIAATVAERYAHSQTYRAFLAAEAENAVHRAEVAAQVATINAQAIAAAQQQLLDDLDTWSPPAAAHAETVPLSDNDFAALFDRDFSPSPSTPVRDTSASFLTSPELPPVALPRLTVHPYADPLHPAPSLPAAPPPKSRSHHLDRDLEENERLALEDEIEFRHHPVFHEPFEQLPIAANLIEFPRQLVAPRKARPRIAEGPLCDETDTNAGAQLRIFEVQPGQIDSLQAVDDAPTEWSSILLSALPSAEFALPDDLAAYVPQAAPIGRRLQAALADGVIILVAQAVFTSVFYLALTRLAGESPLLDMPRPVAAVAAIATLAVFTLIYQLLFFTFADSTPGMRFARIGLCTFADENPSRAAMRRRIVATGLAAFPLGLGLLWALLDEDSLGWHDRISRMYQRAY